MDPRSTKSTRTKNVAWRGRARSILVFLCAAACVLAVRSARADTVSPPPAPQLPKTLSLGDALSIFHKQGLDLLIADAATKNAVGAVKVAGAIANPVVTGSVGNAFTFNNGSYSQNNCLTAGAV